MSETKHIPAPWQLEEEGRIYRNGYGVVCWFDDELDNQDAEGRANARLIAAAPELLEALQIIMTEFQFVERDVITAKIYEQCKSAIAKATGEKVSA
jgi:hypothetical protein